LCTPSAPAAAPPPPPKHLPLQHTTFYKSTLSQCGLKQPKPAPLLSLLRGRECTAASIPRPAIEALESDYRSPASLETHRLCGAALPSRARQVHHFESRVFGARFNNAGDALLLVTQDQHLRLYSMDEAVNAAAAEDSDAQRLFDCRSPAAEHSSPRPSSPHFASAPSPSSDERDSLASQDPGWACTLDVRGRSVGWSIVSSSFSPDDRLVAYGTWSPLVHLLPIPEASVDAGRDESRQANSNACGSAQHAINFQPQCKRFCVYSLAFSPCGGRLLGGASDRCLYLYDLSAGGGRRAAAVQAHGDDVNAVEWLDDNVLLTSGDDRIIKIWDRRLLGQQGASSGQYGAPFTGACGTSAAPSAVLSPCTRSQPVGVLLGHRQGVTCLSARGDGRHFVSNSKDQTAKVWDVRTMSPASDAAHLPPSLAAEPCFDYRWPATHANKVACARALLAAATGTAVPTTSGAPAPAAAAPAAARPCPISSAVSACLMALGGSAFSPSAGTTSNAALRQQATTATSSASTPAAAPLVSSTAAGSPSLPARCPYDRSVLTLTGHRVLETLVRCYFSPLHSTGQRFVYSGSQCGAVMVWDTLTGELVRTLRGHAATVRDVAWHPTQPATLVSASWDCSVAKWQ